jgi:hypothetical protein
MKSTPQCGWGKSRSTTVGNYTLLCICKSSKQTANLPGGVAGGPHCCAMWIGRAESRVRAELTKWLDVKRPDVRARGDMIGIPLPNILD